jgi:hypothetical protein
MEEAMKLKRSVESTPNPELVKELNRVRQLSLTAARQNDFRTVARLTGEALRLNRAIQEVEDVLSPFLHNTGARFVH